ncbi:hypothetical protein SK128_007264 [Halocaridina rubra]|uniref:Mitochondrial transcription rescue factor 1 C-terminal domain-containing protein n=1 Tax=Halocaridina rubra TaxID=373956 RepID=A0AAN8WEV4_HALRR
MGTFILLMRILRQPGSSFCNIRSQNNNVICILNTGSAFNTNFKLPKLPESELQIRNLTSFNGHNFASVWKISSGKCIFKRQSLLVPETSFSGFLSRGKKSKRKTEEMKEKAESTDSEDDDDDWRLETDRDFIDVRAMVPSVRLDAVLKAGLGMSRNKLDTAFYESKLRVNEAKVLKKSKELEEGDEIDVILGPSSTNPDLINVARVIIMKVGNYSDDSDKLPVKLRRYKNLLIRNYEGNNKENEE